MPGTGCALRPAYIALGRLDLAEGRPRDAELAALAAIGAEPLEASAYVLLGEARLAGGSLETALTAFRSGLLLDPFDRDGRGRIGLYRTLSRLGRDPEFRALAEPILPDDPTALALERDLFRRGLAHGARRVRSIPADKAGRFLRRTLASHSMGADGDDRPGGPTALRILTDGSLLYVK